MRIHNYYVDRVFLCLICFFLLIGCGLQKTMIVSHSNSKFELITEIPENCCVVTEETYPSVQILKIGQRKDNFKTVEKCESCDQFEIDKTDVYGDLTIDEVAELETSSISWYHDLIETQEFIVAGHNAFRVKYTFYGDNENLPITEYREHVIIEFPDIYYVITYFSSNDVPDQYFYEEVYNFALEHLSIKSVSQ